MDGYPQEETVPPSFSRWQRWSAAFHVTLSVLAVLGLAVMLNYLAHRHDHRFYLSRSASQKLSPLTLQVLGSLTNSVKIIAFFDRREPLFGAVASLLKEYEARSPHIDLEFVDYRMPGRAEAIRNQYRLERGSETSRIIFDSGTQTRTVLSSELSEFGVTSEKEITRTGFKGEQMFTSALLNITQTRSLTAYFTQGHGEHDPFDDGDRGYSRYARMLDNNNVEVRTLEPLVSGDIPPDCELLVIAGPTHPFEREEIARVEKYLAGGGRLLVLLNASGMATITGLEQLLYGYGIEVGFNWVQDTTQAQAGESAVILTSNYGPHPIVRPLLRSSVKLITPRSITQRQAGVTSADAPKVVELVLTSGNGRAIVPRGGNTWAVQKTGTIPLGAAIERGGVQGVGASRSATRIVAMGDSLFLSNLAFTQAANADFANLIVNWLANRDALLNEIAPRAVSEYQILLTETQMTQLRWMFLGVMPGAVMTLGFLVWLRRRF